MAKNILAVGVAVVALVIGTVAGIASCGGSKPTTKSVPTVINCAGDHDNDCPAGEPDNDGNK
jgi:hypothetical protein